MSMALLLEAVKSRIETALSLTANEKCAVRMDGRCPGFSGELFISVHPGGINNQEINHGLIEDYSVNVTVTRRASFSPEDRTATEIFTKAGGLDDKCREVMLAIHMNYTLMNAANTAINSRAGSARNGFKTPLRYRSMSAPQEVYSDWFQARGAESGDQMYAGLAVTIAFGGMLRPQNLTTVS